MSEYEWLPADYIHDYPRAPRPVAVAGILRRGDLAIVTASWDSFKSTFALELGYSLATGVPFLGMIPAYSVGNVGILQKEIDPGSYDERVACMPATSRLFVCTDFSFRLDRLNALASDVRELGLSALILDPIGAMWPVQAENGEPFNENAKTHVSPLLYRLKALGVTVILVHHDPKPGAGVKNWASGSSALLNDPDTRVHLEREGANKILVQVRSRLQHPTEAFRAVFNPTTKRLRVALGTSKDRSGEGGRVTTG